MIANMKMALVCVECGLVEHVPCAGTEMLLTLNLKELYAEHGWFFSLVDPKERTVAPICRECALKLSSPELIEAAKRELSGKGQSN